MDEEEKRYSLTLYSKELTEEEVDRLTREFSIVGKTPIVHPLLLQFAVVIRNVDLLLLNVERYVEWVNNCSCWHCRIMKERADKIGLCGYDLWLRYILYCNGLPQAQLN